MAEQSLNIGLFLRNIQSYQGVVQFFAVLFSWPVFNSHRKDHSLQKIYKLSK